MAGNTTVVQAGKYRRRITIQRPIQVQDTTGGAVPSWVNVAVNVRAAIEPLSGREWFVAQQVQNDVTTQISFHWRPGIDPTMRILHALNLNSSPPEVEIFNIESITTDATGRKEIKCMCRTRLNSGFRTDG